MITQAVLIQFNEDAPPDALQIYEELKIQLAQLPCVKNMISGLNFVNAREEVIREIHDRVTYPQSVAYGNSKTKLISKTF